MNDFKTWCINRTKVPSTFERPSGMTSHSYKPSLVLKAIFYSSPGRIRIWWYLLCKSILEKILNPTSISNKLVSLRMGNRYITVILLMAWLFKHSRQLPSLFEVINEGMTDILMLSLIRPFKEAFDLFLRDFMLTRTHWEVWQIR